MTVHRGNYHQVDGPVRSFFNGAGNLSAGLGVLFEIAAPFVVDDYSLKAAVGLAILFGFPALLCWGIARCLRPVNRVEW